MPDVLFTMDGKDPFSNGRSHTERLSYKYNHQKACFTVIFVVERVMNTICAVNVDGAGKTADVTVLRDSWWYRDMENLIGDWLIIGDTGYKNEPGIAANVKGVDRRKAKFSSSFWKEFNNARAKSQHAFAHFFVNKFPLLSQWRATGENSFELWAMTLICGVILYNHVKRESLKIAIFCDD